MNKFWILLGLSISCTAMALPFKVKTSKLMGLKVYAKERFKIVNGKNQSKWRGAGKYYKTKQVLIEVKITNSREAVSGLTGEIYYLSEFEKNKVYKVHHKHVTNNISIDKLGKYYIPVKKPAIFNYMTRDTYNLDQFEYDRHYNVHPNDRTSRYPRTVKLPGESTKYVTYIVILKDSEGKIIDGASNSSNMLKYLGTITKLNEGDKVSSKGIKQ